MWEGASKYLGYKSKPYPQPTGSGCHSAQLLTAAASKACCHLPGAEPQTLSSSPNSDLALSLE